jgi:hypothetical protein
MDAPQYIESVINVLNHYEMTIRTAIELVRKMSKDSYDYPYYCIVLSFIKSLAGIPVGYTNGVVSFQIEKMVDLFKLNEDKVNIIGFVQKLFSPTTDVYIKIVHDLDRLKNSVEMMMLIWALMAILTKIKEKNVHIVLKYYDSVVA